MMGWLIRWWKGRRRRERNIFKYWDGATDRAIDPLQAWCDLIDDPQFSLDVHPVQLDLGDRDAIQVAAAATRRVFGIMEFSKGGLTQQECLDLLVTFFEYVTTLKKSTDAFPISLSRTESASSASSITPPAADSISAANVPSSESQPA